MSVWGGQHGGPIASTGCLDFFLLVHEECLTVCLEGQQILVEKDRFWNQKIMTQTLYLLLIGRITLARPLTFWSLNSCICAMGRMIVPTSRLLPGSGEIMCVQGFMHCK